jgi:hypothetical protein
MGCLSPNCDPVFDEESPAFWVCTSKWGPHQIRRLEAHVMVSYVMVSYVAYETTVQRIMCNELNNGIHG